MRIFGGFYHPEVNRKKNPALFLYGKPSTYKTFLITTIWKQLVGLENIDVLSRHNTRFNFGRLKKDNNSPTILFMDDFRLQKAGMFTPDFLNLLDGNFVSIENKFENRTYGSLKGAIILTSNQRFQTKENSPEDMEALETRIKEVEFSPLDSNIQIDEDTFFQTKGEECIGFSILSNALFLAEQKRASSTKVDLPNSMLINKEIPPLETTKLQSVGLHRISKVIGTIKSGGRYNEKVYDPKIHLDKEDHVD